MIESLQQGKQLDKIFLYKKATGDAVQQILQLARQSQVPVQYVPNEKLNSLTNIQHQGVVALTSSVKYYELQEVIDWVTTKGDLPLFIMLDGVTDVRNIGAIARSAVCCGAQAMIIPDKGVAALQEDALKTSAGALEQIHICRVNSLMQAVDTLHLNGIKVFASEMNAPVKLFHLEMIEPCCIIMGSEEKGIYPALKKICDTQFKIPMAGSFESLNVSVAAGMILYEAMKQRMNRSKLTIDN